MKASHKRDQNSTTARIGDRVTEINKIRTEEMTKSEFDLQGNGVQHFKLVKHKFYKKFIILA